MGTIVKALHMIKAHEDVSLINNEQDLYFLLAKAKYNWDCIHCYSVHIYTYIYKLLGRKECTEEKVPVIPESQDVALVLAHLFSV